MARISVWFVRASLLYFAVGVTAGTWRLAATAGLLPSLTLPIQAVHVEVVLLGWLVQFALGVALWIFPFSARVSSDRRLWTAWIALNAGLWLVVIGAWVHQPVVTVAGRGGEVLAGLLVTRVLWPRLRALPDRGHDP